MEQRQLSITINQVALERLIHSGSLSIDDLSNINNQTKQVIQQCFLKCVMAKCRCQSDMSGQENKDS